MVPGLELADVSISLPVVNASDAWTSTTTRRGAEPRQPTCMSAKRATATVSPTSASSTRICMSALAMEEGASTALRTGMEQTVRGARRTSSKVLERSAYLATVILLDPVASNATLKASANASQESPATSVMSAPPTTTNSPARAANLVVVTSLGPTGILLSVTLRLASVFASRMLKENGVESANQVSSTWT